MDNPSPIMKELWNCDEKFTHILNNSLPKHLWISNSPWEVFHIDHVRYTKLRQFPLTRFTATNTLSIDHLSSIGKITFSVFVEKKRDLLYVAFNKIPPAIPFSKFLQENGGDVEYYKDTMTLITGINLWRI